MASQKKQQSYVPHIMLEISNPKKERDLTREIGNLGGTWTKTLQKDATHLVCDQVRCSEKFLGACVRGVWVIKSKFIEDSYKAGKWLPEEEYKFSTVNADQQSARLISAAERWRFQISVVGGEQPFTGWKVSVLPSPNTAQDERLLVYGGAELVKLSLPLKEQLNLSDVVYVFLDESYQREAEVLQNHGVIPLQYEFIKDKVIKDEAIDLDYIVGSKSISTSSLAAESTSCRMAKVVNKADGTGQTPGCSVNKVAKKRKREPVTKTVNGHGTAKRKNNEQCSTQGESSTDQEFDSLNIDEEIDIQDIVVLIQQLEQELHVTNQEFSSPGSRLTQYPPVTATMIKIYIKVLQLESNSGHLLGILENVINSWEENSVLSFDELVSSFQINFNHYLQNKDQCSEKEECLLVKWLWGNQSAVVRNENADRLLHCFINAVSASQPNRRLVTAIGGLIGMMSECLYLSSVEWIQHSPILATDPVMDISHMLAKPLSALFRQNDHGDITYVLNVLRPYWLRYFVISILLGKYNSYLLTEEVVVNQVSLYNIVTQYFFLVPPLTLRHQPARETDGEQPVPKNIDRINNHESDQTSTNTENSSSQTRRSKKKLTAQSINKKNHLGENALHNACKKNNAARLKELLSVPGVDVNMADYGGITPLNDACFCGSKECVELLLKFMPSTIDDDTTEQVEKSYKVNLNVRDHKGYTPLHDAVCKNHVDVALLLLKYGGKKLLEAKTTTGQTPLKEATTDDMQNALKNAYNCDTDTASIPPSYRYEVLLSTSETVKYADMYVFLSFLSVLVLSYYASLQSLRKSGHATGVMDERDQEVLKNMKIHVESLRKHVKKLTSTEDFDALQFELTKVEMICLSGTES